MVLIMQITYWDALSHRNPVYRAEFRHQRFVIATSRSGWLWIALAAAMVIPALIGSLIYIGGAFILPFAPHIKNSLYPLENVLFPAIWVMSTALYIVVTMVTLGLSSNSISREKRNHTWDNLRLTEMDGRRIIWGKWGASLHALWGDHLMAAIIRAGLCAVFIVSYSPHHGRPLGVPGEILAMGFLLVVTAVYSLLDAGLTAALGIIAPLAEKGEQVISAVAFAVRAFVALFAFFWMSITLAAILGGDWNMALFTTGVGWLGYGAFIAITLRTAQKLLG